MCPFFLSELDKQSRDEERTALHFSANYLPKLEQEESSEELDRRCSSMRIVDYLIHKKAKVSNLDVEVIRQSEQFIFKRLFDHSIV